jgi:peroxiredoxin Q/BCP
MQALLKDKSATYLKEGDLAPDFSGIDQNGKVLNLAEFKGKRLALYFYPKDDTSGCTEEACNLRDNYDILKANDIEIIGVSSDDENSHQKFINKYNLPFRLIADTDKSIINTYGVWGKKTVFGKSFDGILRTTFIIDRKGRIEKILPKVDTVNHAEQILHSLMVSKLSSN